MYFKLLMLLLLSILFYKITQTPNKTNSRDLVTESVPTIGYYLGPLGVIVVSTAYAIIAWSRDEWEIWNNYEIFGCILCLFSSLLRLWSYKTLGRLFTFDLAIRSKHKLITNGPYRYIRHPSYTGLILAVFGYSLFTFKVVYTVTQMLHVSDFIAQAIMLFPTIFGTALIIHRIPREEDMLLKEFKDNWMKYSKKTWKLIPFIF